MRLGISILLTIIGVIASIRTVAQTEHFKLRILPDQASGGNVSDYFESVEYIPLETTKESLLGDVHQMIVTNGSYVIYDNDTKSVYFFDLKGSYLMKVRNEINTASRITYDVSANKIVVRTLYLHSEKETFRDYSVVGKMLSKEGEAGRSTGNEMKTVISKDYIGVIPNFALMPGDPGKDSTFISCLFIRRISFTKGSCHLTRQKAWDFA